MQPDHELAPARALDVGADRVRPEVEAPVRAA
jgi:hypothetical protein